MERNGADGKKKVTGLQRLACLLELPAAAAPGVCHLELEGNSQARLESCGAILEYDSEHVRIKTGKGSTLFLGRGLAIRCLSADRLEIHGFFTEIHFVR